MIVRPVLERAREHLGEVQRGSGVYLWIKVQGWPDVLRVSRLTGQGTSQGQQYVAEIADSGALERLERRRALAELMTAVALTRDALLAQQRGEQVALASAKVEEIRELARRLRVLVG